MKPQKFFTMLAISFSTLFFFSLNAVISESLITKIAKIESDLKEKTSELEKLKSEKSASNTALSELKKKNEELQQKLLEAKQQPEKVQKTEGPTEKELKLASENRSLKEKNTLMNKEIKRLDQLLDRTTAVIEEEIKKREELERTTRLNK
jgi:hypothetical protein